MDEAESKNNGQKLFSILVSYFDRAKAETLVYHLATVRVLNTKSATMFNALSEVFIDNSIPWDNLVSILTDNCPSMTGKLTGLEARVREVQPKLLKIGGDSIHRVHNATETLLKPFQNWVVDLINNLYVDFKHSTQHQDWFKTICYLLGLPATSVGRFVSNRWLSIYDTTATTLMIWDALLVYYYAFLSDGNENRYKPVIDQILQEKEVDQAAREILSEINKDLKKEWSLITSATGHALMKLRKALILDHLFYQRAKTLLQLDFIIIVLKPWKIYVKEFQSRSTGIHKYNDKQVALVREIMTRFVKAEVLQDLESGTDMKQHQLQDHDLLPSSEMNIFKDSTKECCEEIDAGAYKEFTQLAKEGLKRATNELVTNLPLDEEVLKCLSVLDPIVQRTAAATKYLKRLPRYFKVLHEEEKDGYRDEVHRLGGAKAEDLPPIKVDNVVVKTDLWWGQLF